MKHFALLAPHSRAIACLCLVFPAALGGCSSDPTGGPLSPDTPLELLDEDAGRALCVELDAITTEDPEYVRGVCSQTGLTLTDSVGSCEEARDRCLSTTTGWCGTGPMGASLDCPKTTVGELLDCVRAVADRTRNLYSGVRCEDPSSVLSADALAAHLGMPLPTACQALSRSCTDLTQEWQSPGLSVNGDGGTTGPDSATETNDPNPFLCGGAYRSPCASDKYCAWDDGCGSAGHCASRTPSCSEPAQVCGCDGETYESECAAASQGVGVSHAGACGAEQFDCGAFRCDDNSYCLDASAQRTDPDQQAFLCLARGDCNDCDCLLAQNHGCFAGETCTVGAEGHLRVRCE